jgi:hypothetical protein
MATQITIKRSAQAGKRPTLENLALGELALNTYEGYLFAERDTGGVGIGTTISLLTPWTENFGAGSIYYQNDVGIGTDTPNGIKLSVDGTVRVTGVSTFTNSVIFDSTGSIQIPKGTTAERLSGVQGQIRYNTELSTFEGYGAGNAWGSLGGVKDVDGDTLIRAESSAGADEDVIEVITAGTVRVAITSTGDVGIGTTIPTNAVTSSNTAKLSVGVVTANTYHGDQIIGTPTGGSFRAGAYVPTATDKTKDSIDELNFILGKLVPPQPTTISGVSLSLTGTAGVGRLCSGFTPSNNTNDAAPVAGTQYTRNTDSTITTNYLTDYGPGDSGTLTGYVNTVGVGTTTFNISFGIYAAGNNAGTSGAVQIANNTDAADSARNVGITSLFYEVYDVRLINAASPDGYNEAYITHGSNTTSSVYWYEDPSTVGSPVISFGAVTAPSSSSHVIAYSSGVAHYTESTNNNFNYVMTVENATGDMYSDHTFVTSDGQTSGFANPGNKTYTQFGGANPPTRNFGVGTGVTCLITNTPRNVHDTITSNHFARYDTSTPYGSHNNQRISYSTNVNLMGTTAITNKIDEDNILISSLGTGSGNATRVNAGSTGDNPTPVFTSWTASGSAATYESIVRGGVLRHDQTNYSSGYLPVGPDYSSGRSGAQYFQVELIRSTVSAFRISVTGSYGACKVCMPDNSTWTTGLSDTNGWADMFTAAPGSGAPRNASPGCASGGVMSGSSGTFTCTFGTESSTNDSNNRILVRWRLDDGDSITAMSFSAT